MLVGAGRRRAPCSGCFLDNGVLTYAFNGMYVADPMTSVLKLFSVLAVGFMLVYAQGYARDRGMWKGELFTLTLFALLGIMRDDLGEQPAGDLPRPGAAGAVAVRAGGAAARRRARRARRR